MKKLLVGMVLLLFSGKIVVSLADAISPSNELVVRSRAWTVKDSVATRYLVRSQTFAGEWGRNPPDWPSPIVFSGDRKFFFFLSYHGDLLRDCPSVEMRVYSVEYLHTVLKSATGSPSTASPHRTIESCGYQPDSDNLGIPDARWSEDGKSIVYSTVDGRGPRQIQRYQIQTDSIELLSDPQHDVFQYDVRGDGVVYSVGTAPMPPSISTLYPTALGTSELIENALEALPGRRLPSRFAIFARYQNGPIRQVGSALDWEPPRAEPGEKIMNTWISPNGRYALMLRAQDSELPNSWLAYDSIRALQARESLSAQSLRKKVRQFFLVDLVNGKSRPVFDSPGGFVESALRPARDSASFPQAADVLWSANSLRAIVVNTALPLTTATEERRSLAYVVDFDIRTGDWNVVTAIPSSNAQIASSYASIGRLSGLTWGENEQELLATYRDADAKDRFVRFELRGNHWISAVLNKPHNARSVHRSSLNVVAHEGANESPQIFASNGSRKINLLPPDPALSDVHRVDFQEIQWSEGKGKVSKGGLLLPDEKQVDGPFPLVIQAYDWLPDQFLPDGPASAAYAAQPLVSQGMAVLLINIPGEDPLPDGEKFDYSDEGQAFVRRIDSAVKTVAQKFPVDPHRVGVVGFSRAGYMIYYAVTHAADVKLAAAVVADSTTLSYGEYVAAVGQSTEDGPIRALFESQYGSKTFWQSKETWIREAPMFNLDRAQTPLFMMYHGIAAPVNVTYELLGAFRLNRVPYEMLFFPSGTHQLRTPREREASLQATVDWMGFWLKGRLPQDSDRATRWKIMRNKQVPYERIGTQ